MEKVARLFSSFEAADEADHEAYAAMSCEERLKIAIQLYWMWNDPEDETTQRLARVYRFTELESC